MTLNKSPPSLKLWRVKSGLGENNWWISSAVAASAGEGGVRGNLLEHLDG